MQRGKEICVMLRLMFSGPLTSKVCRTVMKEIYEIIGQQHPLYKYNPASPDSWFNWEDFPNKQHWAWWPWFSWLGVRSLGDLNWQSCTVVSSSLKLAASTLEQFWEVTAPCSLSNTVHSVGKHSNRLCPSQFFFFLGQEVKWLQTPFQMKLLRRLRETKGNYHMRG